MNRVKKIIMLITLIIITLSNAFSIYAADTTTLTQARDDLQTVIDNQNDSLNGNSYYEVSSYHSFMEIVNGFGGIVGVQAVIDDALADQGVVDDLVITIYNAISGLVTYTTFKMIQSNLNQSKTLPSNTYTQDSTVAYFEGLSDVELILYNPTSGESTISGLNSVIIEMTLLLVLLPDNEALLTKYSELRNEDITGYTMDSITTYNLELNRLYDLIVSPNLDSFTVQQIIDDLNVVSNLLVGLPDFTELQNLYDSTSAYNEADYSVSSYQALLDAKTFANNVIIDLNATEALVVNAITLLNDSIEELSSKIDTIYINEGEEININQYITQGQASIIEYTSQNSAVVNIDNLGLVRGQSFGETSVSVELDNGAVEIINVFVKAKPGVAVYVLTFSIPVGSAAVALGMLYIKKNSWKRLFEAIKKIFKRRK